MSLHRGFFVCPAWHLDSCKQGLCAHVWHRWMCTKECRKHRCMWTGTKLLDPLSHSDQQEDWTGAWVFKQIFQSILSKFSSCCQWESWFKQVEPLCQKKNCFYFTLNREKKTRGKNIEDALWVYMGGWGNHPTGIDCWIDYAWTLSTNISFIGQIWFYSFSLCWYGELPSLKEISFGGSSFHWWECHLI